jgi:hypothetical protein
LDDDECVLRQTLPGFLSSVAVSSTQGLSARIPVQLWKFAATYDIFLNVIHADGILSAVGYKGWPLISR